MKGKPPPGRRYVEKNISLPSGQRLKRKKDQAWAQKKRPLSPDGGRKTPMVPGKRDGVWGLKKIHSRKERGGNSSVYKETPQILSHHGGVGTGQT